MSETRVRASRSPTSSPPLPPGPTGAELILGDRPEESALDTDSKIRCALTRLAAAVLDGRVDRGRANAAKFIVDGIAGRLDREFERQARTRELDLREREIETARELAAQLEAHRARVPHLTQAVQVLLGDRMEEQRRPARALEAPVDTDTEGL